MDELPGESLVKPLPRELLHDYGCNAEMCWEAVADQGYEIPNNHFYIRSHSPTPNRPASWSYSGPPELPEGLHEIPGQAWSSADSISSVKHVIDGGEWRQTEMQGPNAASARVRFEWEALIHQLYGLTTP